MAAIQLQDPARNIVKEIPVMRDSNDRPLVLLQMLLKPLDGFGVEMIRWLIEEQNVRFLYHQAAERNPPLFPAGQRPHFLVGRRTT